MKKQLVKKIAGREGVDAKKGIFICPQCGSKENFIVINSLNLPDFIDFYCDDCNKDFRFNFSLVKVEERSLLEKEYYFRKMGDWERSDE